jgi:anti-sigma factor RsiW
VGQQFFLREEVMHSKIKHNLEEYLRGQDYLSRSGSGLAAEAQAHLGECAECAREVEALREQSQMLRSLGSEPAGGSLEPRPGFYARVVERIQAQPVSIWSVFLERKFGLRLAVSSAAAIALLGTYLVISELSSPEIVSAPAAAVQTAAPPASEAALQRDEALRQRQQRDAVLADLASFHQ